jgi:hypothetical protein
LYLQKTTFANGPLLILQEKTLVARRQQQPRQATNVQRRRSQPQEAQKNSGTRRNG